MELPYNQGTMPLPDITGYQIKVLVPGMGCLFSNCWLVGSHRHHHPTKPFRLLSLLLFTLQNLMIGPYC